VPPATMAPTKINSMKTKNILFIKTSYV